MSELSAHASAATQAAPAAASAPARELTLRAVLAGCGIGALLAVGNVYMGLKTGWGDGGNITAAVLGFAFFNVVRKQGFPYTRLENNITQTTAASAASMSFTAGLVGAFPALALLGYHYHWWFIVLFSITVGALGILLAIPLRRRLILDEALPFPTGLATAEVIDAMHVSGGRAIERARALLGSVSIAAVVSWLRDGYPAWIPQVSALPGRLLGVSARSLTLGFSWSPMLLGTGMLIGVRNGASILAGAVIGWGVLAPWVVHARVIEQASYDALVGWLLWPGVSLMTTAALTSLVLGWRTFARTLDDFRGLGRAGTGRTGLLVAGAAAGLLILLSWRFFGMTPLITLVALAASVVLATVCARATGETDIAPVTQMGQLTQLGIGLKSVTPAVDVGAAAIVSGQAAQTAQMLWAFKAGERLGADARRQVYAQLLGVGLGALVVVPAYLLLSRAYGLGSDLLPAPTASAWKALVELLRGGSAAFPPYANIAAAFGAAAGIALVLLERTRLRSWLPSPVAMGVGFLAPASYAVTIFAGSLVLAWAGAHRPAESEVYGAPVAAGAIAGESLIGVLTAVLKVTGVLG